MGDQLETLRSEWPFGSMWPHDQLETHLACTLTLPVTAGRGSSICLLTGATHDTTADRAVVREKMAADMESRQSQKYQ